MILADYVLIAVGVLLLGLVFWLAHLARIERQHEHRRRCWRRREDE